MTIFVVPLFLHSYVYKYNAYIYIKISTNSQNWPENETMKIFESFDSHWNLWRSRAFFFHFNQQTHSIVKFFFFRSVLRNSLFIQRLTHLARIILVLYSKIEKNVQFANQNDERSINLIKKNKWANDEQRK